MKGHGGAAFPVVAALIWANRSPVIVAPLSDSAQSTAFPCRSIAAEQTASLGLGGLKVVREKERPA